MHNIHMYMFNKALFINTMLVILKLFHAVIYLLPCGCLLASWLDIAAVYQVSSMVSAHICIARCCSSVSIYKFNQHQRQQQQQVSFNN